MPYIEGFDRNQAQMFPEYLDNYINEENPVRVIDAFVDSLDLHKYAFTKLNKGGPGAPSYNPKDLLKLYIYGYINGIRTSRKLERATYVNVEIMWLIRKLHPDFKTIADFRKENKTQFKQIFREFNLLCRDADLFGDQGHLNTMVQEAKDALGMGEKDRLEVVADKGYYQADDLMKCEENGTVTYVTHQTYSNATGNPEYYSDKFIYDSKEDVYICPEGQKLYRTKHSAKEIERIKYKNYRACKQCPNKDKCTKSSKGRTISRSIHQDFLDVVDARTLENMDKYLERQMIVEHPFGTVKMTMNAGYFLTRGEESVRGEASLTFLAYNMKRVINILGTSEIIRQIKKRSALIFNKIKPAIKFPLIMAEKKILLAHV